MEDFAITLSLPTFPREESTAAPLTPHNKENFLIADPYLFQTFTSSLIMSPTQRFMMCAILGAVMRQEKFVLSLTPKKPNIVFILADDLGQLLQ